MKIFFRALGVVLMNTVKAVATVALGLLAVTLMAAAIKFSIWLALLLVALIIIGVCVYIEMEEIKFEERWECEVRV